ncbi:MAG: condensation domain-containing protein [Acidobacteriota bacterium]
MSEIAERLAKASPEEKRALLAQLLRQKVQRPKCHPLSFAQERLWVLDQLMRGSTAYNIPAGVRLKGPLNLAAFEQSLNEIRRRHEILRTTFAVAGEEPVQVIGSPEPVPVRFSDLSELPETEREPEALRLVTEEWQRPFDLTRGSLLRVNVLRLGDEDHVVAFTIHHIVSDGWSMRVLVKELMALYQAFSEGKPSPLSELPIQYGDYARRQREELSSNVLETQIAYWKQQLDGSPPLLELPTDHARPPVQSFNGGFQSIVLAEALREPLRQLSRRHSATLFIALLTAFQILLHYGSGQTDIVVGTPVAGRDRVETEGLIGFFVNTLLLRLRISGDPTFRELLSQVRETVLQAQANQDVPFEKLVEVLQPERNTSYMPLFQVAFSFTNAPRKTFTLPDLGMTEFGAPTGTAKFDLDFAVVETNQRLIATLEYSTDLYEAATILQMLKRYETLLLRIVARPDARLSEYTQALVEADSQRKIAEEQHLTQARLEKFKQVRRKRVTSA